jgi:hypothetical protein
VRREAIVCRLVGCTSVFARFWEWPHLHVCDRRWQRQHRADLLELERIMREGSEQRHPSNLTRNEP